MTTRLALSISLALLAVACGRCPEVETPKSPASCDCPVPDNLSTTSAPVTESTVAPITYKADMPYVLPAPNRTGGMPIMDALSARSSAREFSPEPLSPQQLSDLLYAAWGINRKETGKRTAPSALNWQDISVLIVLEQGVFFYDAQQHALIPRIEGDLRAKTGKQPFVATAPLNIVYVSDLSKMGKAPEESHRLYAGAHAGFISQNIYLYCTSEKLNTVVRGYFDGEDLSKALGLNEGQIVVLTQTVGQPLSKMIP